MDIIPFCFHLHIPFGISHGAWCKEYERPLQTFLEAMRKCEDEAIRNKKLVESQRLSGRMRDSWQSGDFWIMYAARNNFAFDAIYWKKIDQRFFRPTIHEDEDFSEVWRERLHLLEPGEKELMEEYVNLKVKERNTWRLAWDPDEYTVGWIKRMKEIKRKEEMERDAREREEIEREEEMYAELLALLTEWTG